MPHSDRRKLELPEELLLAIFELSIHTPPNPPTANDLAETRLDGNPTEAERTSLNTDRLYPDDVIRSRVTTHPTNSFTPLTLGHVCRDWRVLSSSAPQLWSKIYVTNGSTEGHCNLLKIYLKNSGSLPLDLVFRDSKKGDLRGRSIVQMIEVVATASLRWRSLKIRFRYFRLLSSTDIVSVIRSGTTPNLEALAFSFNCNNHGFTDDWMELIRGAPRLNEIQMWRTMDHVPTFLAIVPHDRLRTLTLPMVHFTSPSGLLGVMRKCNKLASLSISLYPLRHQVERTLPIPTDEEIVRLPNLVELYIVEIVGRRAAHLLPYFDFPSLTTLSVHLRSGNDPESLERYDALEDMLARSGCRLRSFTFIEECATPRAVALLVRILGTRAFDDLVDLKIGSAVGADLLRHLVVSGGNVEGGDAGKMEEQRVLLPALRTLEFGHLGFETASTFIDVIASRTKAPLPACTKLDFVKVGFMFKQDFADAKSLWDARGIESDGPVERIFRVVGWTKEARMLKEEVVHRDFSMLHGWIPMWTAN